MWRMVIALRKPVPIAEIVWHRVRFRFQYSVPSQPVAGPSTIAGIESISQVLECPVVRILGQSEYLAGSTAAVRVIVASAAGNMPETGSLRIELPQPSGPATTLFNGRLNQRGTVEAQLRFPAGLTGSHDLHYIAETPTGTAEYTQHIRLQEKASILLTTEKPLYQPGQVIHLRALALDRADHRSESNRNLSFEVEDARGNKVFRKATETDRFGVASAEFTLADEVNLGTYRLRALLGDANTPSSTAELALNVERYTLPKFKVAVEFAEKDGKPRKYYRPGDHVTGTVRANYFFGKPVDHADVTVKASSMDVEVFDAGSTKGSTDAEGNFHFDLTLPSYFAGRPLSQGAARALVEATVKDAAQHSETRGEPITVSQSPLLLTAVPEGGTLALHLSNNVFVLASYPDGTPATTSLRVRYGVEAEQQVTTDSAGVAEVRLTPIPGLDTLHVEADDHKGNRAGDNLPMQIRGGSDQILLQADRALLRVGDRMRLRVLSTHSTGAAYIDVVENGQTILTRDVDLQNGQAELTLPVTPAMTGTLDLDAYLIGGNAQPVADHRLVFVQPADELKIETVADAALYKPGSDASVRFHVTNARGEGVSAALGVQVVDEAVFALAEKKPGFAMVFFYLEQEVMKPRYEIHSLSLPGIVDPVESMRDEPGNRAAQALFAANELVMPAKFDVEFGRTLPMERYTIYQQRYREAFLGQLRILADQMNTSLHEHPDNDMVRVFNNLTMDDGSHPHDAWGTPLRIDAQGRGTARNRFYPVRGAGPDRRFDSSDDLVAFIEERTGEVVTSTEQGGDLRLNIEHDRGPVTPYAELSGTVTDPTGAVIPNATITLRSLSGGGVRGTHADNSGQFHFAGLTAGRYQMEAASPGFATLTRSLTLDARDWAEVSAMLILGNATTMVMVTAAAAPLMDEGLPVFRAGAGGRAAMGMAMAQPAGATEVTEAVAAKLSPMLRTEDTVIGATLDESAMEAIPMNGRASFDLKQKQPAPAAHVRSYFPEALYINPEIITDAHGNATISVPVADSITTWRMAMLASTESGALGTGTSSLKVFQDFFVDLDLPVTLTQGDRVTLPVAVYNYAGQRGQVSLKLQPEDWYAAGDVTEKTVAVDAGKVGSAEFTLTAQRIGKFKLTLSAHMPGSDSSADRNDIVVREIEVIPNGQEQSIVFNGRLDSAVQHPIALPATAIPDATSIVVRLYPGPLSQIVEGMDSILQMPNGCFEQTSSSTYPNVLALDYMKHTGKLTPEVHAKAEGYIANGYQRLLTFEVPGGGFSWFGQAPANKILTAYGLMEFNDMAKVSDVDPRLIARTRDWLARQQQSDGGWRPDTAFINEGATNRYNKDELRITAYIAWALVNTGYQGPAVERAKRFIAEHMDTKPDAYTLAVIANFAVDYAKDHDFTRQAMQALLDARTEQGDQASWTAPETGVYSTGASAAVETTGLAVQALLKWGQASEASRKALAFLTAKKQAAGNWGTTQATIMALRALLLASQTSGADVRGNVQVLLNGKAVGSLELTADNNDLFHQMVFNGIDPAQANAVELKFSGSGSLAYQVVGRYFTPWQQDHAQEPLAIHVDYDRTKLAQNDIATATVTVRNNLLQTANMVMVDLGIPPGFDLLSEDLQSMQEKTAGDRAGGLEKFSLTATQAILYFNALNAGQSVTFSIRLRAKYPIRAKTLQSRVYEYYDPAIAAIAQPIPLEVSER